MMRSESTSAVGQPRETSPTRGAGLAAARRAFGAALAVGCGMARLVAPTVRQGNFRPAQPPPRNQIGRPGVLSEAQLFSPQGGIGQPRDRQCKSVFILERTFHRRESLLL